MPDLANDLDRTLGPHYRIVRELSGGGMSQVFLAVEVALDREVVIKVLPPNLAVGVSTDRFRREMQTVARLQHPHIVPVLSSGMAGDLLYYIMPYIKGESLRARLQRDVAMPVEESARLLREVADALSFAHAQGVVHRDIKPDNVLLSSGHALVTDFGVAKALGVGDPGQEGGLTSVGMALGTPVYMAPEQAMADPHVDHRADLYALGVMAYEMLAGQPPFVAPTPQALIAAHMTRTPESLRVTRSAVPEAFDDLVQRLLAKRPEDRVQHAAELLPVLDRLSMPGGMLSAATPYFTSTSGAAAKPARDVASLAAPVGGMLLMLAAAWGIRQSLGLPDWVVVAAIALVLLSVPLTLRITRRRAGTPASLMTHAASSRGMIAAGLVSILGLGAAAGAFMGLRAAGIGPFATLLSAGKLNARDRILVAEFGNSTPDTLLGAALTEALSIDLSQSKVVRFMSPVEIRDGLTRMQRDSKSRLTSEVATELAAREGVKLVVAGDVAPFAGGFALSARVLDAQGTTLFATRTTANTASEIIPAVAKLSRTLREAIGESLQSIRATPALEQVSTSSLEALQLYSRAIRSQRAGDDIDRLPLFRQAVALDSTFAMAWRGIYADLNNLFGDPAQRLDAVDRIYRFKDRLPAHEALLAEALHASSAGDRERAVESYRRIVASWPDDMAAHNGVGLHLRALGRFAESEQALSTVVNAGTASASSYYNLVTTLIPQRKFDAAERTLTLLRERYPKSPQRWQAGYFLAAATNKFDVALAMGDSLTHTDNAGYRYWGHLFQAEVFWLRGQVAAGQASTRAARQAQLDQRNPGTALREQLWEVWIAFQLRADTASARAQVDAALAATNFDSLPLASRPWGDLVRLRAGLGQLPEARRIVAQYDKSMPKLWRTDDASMERAMAQLALAEGRPRDALPLARTGAESCMGCTSDLVGQAFEKLGQVDSAIVAYERALEPPVYGSGFQNWRPAVIPRAMFRLGELYAQQGKKQLARDRYASFLDLWDKADPVLQPVVRSARERMLALVGER